MLNKFVVVLFVVIVGAMAYITYDSYFVDRPAPIAKIAKSKGLVNIRRGAEVVAGQQSALLYEGDQLNTSKNSTARVQLSDGSMLVLGPETSFGFGDYNYSNEAKKLSLQFKLANGAIRMATGRVELLRKISIIDARGNQLKLSSGDVVVAQIENELTALVISADDDVVISNRQGKQTLNSGFASVVAPRSEPSEPAAWPEARIAQILALVFEG